MNVSSSLTYRTPAPGYYTDDDIPDFIIHWQYGPGFPIYYHSVVSIVFIHVGLFLFM